MKFDSLEMMAMSFLRFEKACPVALFERSPRHGIGEPDVLGITKARYLLEIEIKRSVSDFKANSKKHHIKLREDPQFSLQAEIQMPKFPKQFWFLVPCELVKKVEPLIPDYAGLMRGPDRNESQSVRVVKKAPSNNASTRLSCREMIWLGHIMANQIWSFAAEVQTYKNKFNQGHYDFYWSPEI